MKVKGWKYYNHAAIPTTPPYETPNLEPIKNGDIWKIGGGTNLCLLDGLQIGIVNMKPIFGT